MDGDTSGVRFVDGVTNDDCSVDISDTVVVNGVVASKLLSHIVQLNANEISLGVTNQHLERIQC